MAAVVMVPMDSELAAQYREYARVAGISFEKAVNKAADRWMGETGALVYEQMVKRGRRANVTPITARR